MTPRLPPALDLKVVRQPISALRLEGRAARSHSDKQMRALVASIRQFGFITPVLIDEAGVVLAGRARLAAAQQVGLTDVPTLRLDHLSSAEKRAYVLADNRIAELAGWSKDILALELKELSLLDADFELEITGFSTLEIEALTIETGADDDGEATIAEGPAITQLGQIWQLGPHRLLCGDATLLQSYRAVMAGDIADAVFTDPPYNVTINGHVRTRPGSREFVMAAGEMSVSQFTAFLSNALAGMASVTKDGGVIFTCMDWRHLGELDAARMASTLDLINVCVWDKGAGGMGSFYRSQHELVFVMRKGRTAHRNNVELGRHGRNRSNVWSYPGANMSAEGRAELSRHPTPKPIALVADALLDCTARGEIVLDPFCGGGATIIAAERTGRVARAIELDPLYVDAIVRRWQDEVGVAAHCAITGLPFAQGAPPPLQQTPPVSIRSRRRSHVAEADNV
jgi:DNA modification methylase